MAVDDVELDDGLGARLLAAILADLDNGADGWHNAAQTATGTSWVRDDSAMDDAPLGAADEAP